VESPWVESIVAAGAGGEDAVLNGAFAAVTAAGLAAGAVTLDAIPIASSTARTRPEKFFRTVCLEWL
jgi:hypothetical protein